MGNGRAEASSTIGDGGQAAVSFTPDVDGRCSKVLVPCWIHFYLGSWKKRSSDVWVIALFFSSHPRWHGGTGLCSEWLLQPFVYCSTLGFCASKANSISKKIPSPFPALWLSLVLQLLLSLASLCSFLWTSNFWCLLAVPATSPLFDTCFWTSWCWNKDTVLYVVLYSKVHKSTTACRGCTRVTVYTRHMS